MQFTIKLAITTGNRLIKVNHPIQLLQQQQH